MHVKMWHLLARNNAIVLIGQHSVWITSLVRSGFPTFRAANIMAESSSSVRSNSVETWCLGTTTTCPCENCLPFTIVRVKEVSSTIPFLILLLMASQKRPESPVGRMNGESIEISFHRKHSVNFRRSKQSINSPTRFYTHALCKVSVFCKPSHSLPTML